MGIHNTKSEATHSTVDATHHLFEDWFDPIEKGVRERVRGFIEELVQAELEEALSRPRYGRAAPIGAVNAPCGHRHGHRSRTVMGTRRASRAAARTLYALQDQQTPSGPKGSVQPRQSAQAFAY
jgi:hypothetical protein